MTRPGIMPAIIADDIDLIAGEREKLLRIFHFGPATYEERRRMLREAEEASLAKLRAAGAVIRPAGTAITIRFKGLKATSEIGLISALGNWANAARSKLQGGSHHE